MITLPHSEACERNKWPILKVIKDIFTRGTIIEVGSGTGQHAEFFAEELAVKWQASDQADYLESLKARKIQNNCSFLEPFSLKIGDGTFSKIADESYDGMFSANTLHIMDEEDANRFAQEVSPVLRPEADLVVYGPFIFDPDELAQSNQSFDLLLKSRNPNMGIRSFDKLDRLFKENHLALVKVYEMPSNNHLLHYRKFV